MGAADNPAMNAFLASFTEERVWAQILVRRTAGGFELRHVSDRAVASDTLTDLRFEELRKFSLTNSAEQFRPLKAAPDLRPGWRLTCRNEGELWRALQDLYPGSLPDWQAVQTGTAAPTHYREYASRQTGMYRIAQLLTDEQAGQVAAACCHPQFCLKQRLWTVAGLETDPSGTKSAIPCLEPCAVLLELARKSARIEQEEKLSVSLAPTDLEALLASAESLAALPPAGVRIGDIAAPLNPRRLQLLLEKYRAKVNRSPAPEE